MWAIITSKPGLAVIALVLVLCVFGYLRGDVAIKTHERDAARADAKDAQHELKLSEDRRAVEFSLAVKDLGDAETACSARVAQAVKSGAAIHAIIAKPVRLDPQTQCPLRDLVSADELRHALQP